MDSWDDVAEQMRWDEVDRGVTQDAFDLAELVLKGEGRPERAGTVAKRVVIAARLTSAKRDPLNSPY